MYAPANPSGMFVTYPNDNETTELLRQRVLNLVAGMFVHDDKGRVVTAITWYERPVPSHSDDGDGRASAYLNDGFPKQVQVVMYERTGSRPFLYGYFAMRSKWDKCPDGRFLDDQGQGVKVFEDLWNSFKISDDSVSLRSTN